jgi:propionyl-CoA carboxylase beta chain
MEPEGACNIIFRKEITGSKDPQKKREELVQDYRTKFANPYIADRPKRKHGNIPV